MLRDPEAVNASEKHATAQTVVGVSAGTAAVLGLQCMRQADVPTTAYLMVGNHCLCDCAFCAQARSSTARQHLLSRVTWPPYPLDEALRAVAHSFERGEIVRCCLQVTVSAGYLPQALSLVRQLRSISCVPICASVVLSDVGSIRSLLECGVERVTLALDAACERVHHEAKHGDWQRQLGFLHTAAQLFPGHIGTHVIAGLGETEQEMAMLLQEMVDVQVTVGLFAFTPVRGTLWGNRLPPALSSYRRIQVACFLLSTALCRVQDFTFSPAGQTLSYGVNRARLRELLADGQPFRTAGCTGCNRPYYNERPGRATYNYPRRLCPEEIEAATSLVLTELACE